MYNLFTEGDSGGPLIDANDGKLIGLTSFDRKDGIEKKMPQAFTDLSFFHSWIGEVTGMNLTGPFLPSSDSRIQSYLDHIKSIFSD